MMNKDHLAILFLSPKSLELLLCCRVPGIKSHTALALGSGFPSMDCESYMFRENFCCVKQQSVLTVGLNFLQILISKQKIFRM